MKILLYFAFVLFFLATFLSDAWAAPAGTPLTGRLSFNLMAAGLTCWVGSLIF